MHHSLGIVDYLVILFCLLFALFIGIYNAHKTSNKSSEELLVGGRKMGTLPVAASVLVTYLSAIHVLGYPSEIYYYGSQFLMTIIGSICLRPIVLYLMVDVFYGLKLTSVYEYLEIRYDSVFLRLLGASVFIVQMLLVTGVALYAPSLVLEAMMGVPIWISIVVIGIIGTFYTSIGGFKAVVWTDVFQFVMIVIGIGAILGKGAYSAGGVSKIFEIAGERGRLAITNWTADPFMRHNTLNLFFGGGFLGMTWTMQQPVVQRYCSLPSFREAIKCFLWGDLFWFSCSSLLIFTGITVFAHYADCDPFASHQIPKPDQILPFFVIEELSFLPGMMGLFAAVIFSAVLSTLSSALNSMAAVTWKDFLSKTEFFSNLDETGQSRTYKVLSVIYGFACVGLAFAAEHMGNILQGYLSISGVAIGVMGAVFMMGVALPFVNKWGAMSGIVGGVGVVGYIALSAMQLQTIYDFQPKLSLSTEGCSDDVLNGNGTYPGTTLLPGDDVTWPEKIFTISYILYALLGAVVTVVIGCAVSCLTNGCRDAANVKPELLHPLVRPSTSVKATNGKIPQKSPT